MNPNTKADRVENSSSYDNTCIRLDYFWDSVYESHKTTTCGTFDSISRTLQFKIKVFELTEIVAPVSCLCDRRYYIIAFIFGWMCSRWSKFCSQKCILYIILCAMLAETLQTIRPLNKILNIFSYPKYKFSKVLI